MKNMILKTLLIAMTAGASMASAETQSSQRALIAYLKVQPGTQAQFLAASKNVIIQSRKEPGNLVYILQQSLNDPEQFVFYELFKTDADLEQHRNAVHTLNFLKEVDSILVPGQFILDKFNNVK